MAGIIHAFLMFTIACSHFPLALDLWPRWCHLIIFVSYTTMAALMAYEAFVDRGIDLLSLLTRA